MTFVTEKGGTPFFRVSEVNNAVRYSWVNLRGVYPRAPRTKVGYIVYIIYILSIYIIYLEYPPPGQTFGTGPVTKVTKV